MDLQSRGIEMNLTLPSIVCSLVFAGILAADVGRLSDTEVTDAIRTAGSGKHGLFLTDGQISGRGINVTIYTPIAWIREYARSNKIVTVADVPDSMRESVWRIDASWEVADVNGVVIRNKAKTIEVKPIRTEEYVNQQQFGFRLSLPQKAVRTQFSADDVLKVWGPAKDTEFVIVVTWERKNTRGFTVKRKHFSRLP
jgi:hypothetical protein